MNKNILILQGFRLLIGESTFSRSYYILLKLKIYQNLCEIKMQKALCMFCIYQSIKRRYIYHLVFCIMFYWISIKIYLKLKNFYEWCLTQTVKKYSGSHRKLRPAGAEYIKNVAAHSGFPYIGQRGF